MYKILLQQQAWIKWPLLSSLVLSLMNKSEDYFQFLKTTPCVPLTQVLLATTAFFTGLMINEWINGKKIHLAMDFSTMWTWSGYIKVSWISILC